MLSRLTLSVFIALFTIQAAFADTFIVTSNADSGPGTLREAITMANANGTVVTDYIHFNIADVSEAGRTINLQSTLPSLSSNIILDGSTQPGSKFTISDAKILLYQDHFIEYYFTFILIQNATNVKVVGMGFKAAAVSNINAYYAIRLRWSFDIIIGEPGKGNLFSGIINSVSNHYWNYYDDSVRNVTIQSNVCGLRRIGADYNIGGHIYFLRCRNITIGGSQPNEGNIFTGSMIDLDESPFPNPDFLAKIENNFFNYDGLNYTNEIGYISIHGNVTDNINNIVRTTIKNNLISSANWYFAIGLSEIKHRVIIHGNKLGTDVTGQFCQGERNGINVYLCSNVIVGGHLPEEENIIIGDINRTIPGTHVIKNYMGGSIQSPGSPPTQPFIKVLTYDNGLITGIANPNSKIQLYEVLGCFGGFGCIKKKYFEATFSDITGKWSFPYTPTMFNLVATSTTPDSTTSSFSEPKIDQSNRVVINATCGKSNGSITGIKILEGTYFEWTNPNTGQVVGTDTNLVNVPAGSYDLSVYNGKNGCPYRQGFYINNIEPPPFLNPSANITDASCGKNNGSIVTYSFDYGSKWLDTNNDSIGTGYYINNLFPGTYYLKLWISYDTSCNKTYGPYTIINLSGPTIDLNNIQITPATCENANGSIKNITATNFTGTPFIQWVDSLNNSVGSSFDLINVPAGKYKLKFKDQGGCDTIITPYYIIPATGRITIDSSQLKIQAAGCTVANGSISGLSFSNATNFTWDGLPPSYNAPSIYGLQTGQYKITVSNIYGCTAQATFAVPTAALKEITPDIYEVVQGTCSNNNGSITIKTFKQNNPAYYTFRWNKLETGEIMGTGLSLNNLSPGHYELTIIDTNGCYKTVFGVEILDYIAPVIITSDIKITPDQCSTNKGAIAGIIVGVSRGPEEVYWIDENNSIVSRSKDLFDISAGKYQLIAKDNDCISKSEWFTVPNSNINTTPQYDDQVISRFTSASLKVKNPVTTGTYFLCSDATATQIIAQNSTGVFTIQNVTNDIVYYIKHINGSCISPVVPVKITVIDKSYFAIASAFTPNKDGLNDLLTLQVIGYLDVEYFKIFNRNGEEVFSTKAIGNGWNGSINGMEQPSGVFVWIAKGKDINGNTITDKGTFVLIR